MHERGRGLFYRPSPPPQAGGEAALRQWCEREFTRLSDALSEGRSEFLRLDPLHALPQRPFDGMVGYFMAGVAGTEAGTYEYRNGAWAKL